MSEQEKLIKQQQEHNIKALKFEARQKALMSAPTSKRSGYEKPSPLTATEIISEADVIYNWLVKDLEN